MDLRLGRGDNNRIRALAQELVGLQPDIIATNGTPATAAVQRETRTIPIVFANVTDPVASGIVAFFAETASHLYRNDLLRTPICIPREAANRRGAANSPV
jgi:putative ABC transport system substrate-binding protein